MRRLIIILLFGLVISIGSVSYVNTVEIPSEVSFIKLLPTDNPYQALYDEMLAPTVRIESVSGIGSGVIIHHKGTKNTEKSIYILTASHVVGNNTSVTVTIYSYISNTQTVLCDLRAFVVMTDTGKDLALLRINPPQSPFIKGGREGGFYCAKLANKNYVPYLFTPVYAVGCSLGLPPRPSQGILTVINNPDNLRSSASNWEISAPILPGNSGGPVFDANTHEVIGIAVWVKVYHGQLVTTMAGIVPINQIYDFLDKFYRKGTKNSWCPCGGTYQFVRYCPEWGNQLGYLFGIPLRRDDVSFNNAHLEGAIPADRADDVVKRAWQSFAKQQLVLRKDITMPTLFEVKLEIPEVSAAAADIAEKWAKNLGDNAELVENRIKTAIPDEATYQSRLATPAAEEWTQFVNPAYRTKRGHTRQQLVNTFAKNIGNAFGHWLGRITDAFAIVDGVKAKRFKDAVNNARSYIADQLRAKALRITGDRVHGIGAGSIAVYWLTGEPTVAGKLRPGDQLIDGAPSRICQIEMVQAFRAALMNRFVQGAMLISNSNYDAAIITEQNTINNHLVQTFVDPGLGLIPFAPGAGSNVDFVIEDGIYKLRLKATTV